MTNNNDYLSQEEIDALLKQSGDQEESVEETSDNAVLEQDHEQDFSNILTSMEEDALGEIGNITFGSAATALSTLLGKKVDITTPRVSVIKRENLIDEFPKPHVAVHVQYVEGLQGINSLIIRTQDAKVIADLMLGGDGSSISEDEELNEIHISAVQEAMNQMMGSSATSMSTIFNRLVNISPPGIDILNVPDGQGMAKLPEGQIFIKVAFRLTIEDLIDSTIMQLLPVDFAKELVQSLMGGRDAEVMVNHESDSTSAQSEDVISEEELSNLLSASQAEQAAAAQQMAQPAEVPNAAQQPVQPTPPPMEQPQIPVQGMGAGYGHVQNQRHVNVQPVQYTNFAPHQPVHSDDVNLNLLMDIPLKVTVELGRTQRLIKDILEFTQGSIIELDKLAGEPVDILVNNKLIAKGEVVVIDENFGVRVTDIVSQADRIQKLQ